MSDFLYCIENTISIFPGKLFLWLEFRSISQFQKSLSNRNRRLILIPDTRPVRPAACIVFVSAIVSHCVYCCVSCKFTCRRFFREEKRDILLQIFHICRWKDSISLRCFNRYFVFVSFRIREIMVDRCRIRVKIHFYFFSKHLNPLATSIALCIIGRCILFHISITNLSLDLCSFSAHLNLSGKFHCLSHVYALRCCLGLLRKNSCDGGACHCQTQEKGKYFIFFLSLLPRNKHHNSR